MSIKYTAAETLAVMNGENVYRVCNNMTGAVECYVVAPSAQAAKRRAHKEAKRHIDWNKFSLWIVR